MEEVKKRIRQIILCEQNVAPGKTAFTVNCRRTEEANCRNSQKKLENLLLQDTLSETQGNVSARLSRKLLNCPQ